MKRNQIVSYAVLAVVVVAAVVAAIVLTTGGDSKPKPKPLTVTQKAGIALKRDFNKAEAAEGIQIARIVKCAQDPKNSIRFECLAVVSNADGSQSACGDFLFQIPNGVVKPENVQAVDPQNCK
jgi:archaellin